MASIQDPSIAAIIAVNDGSAPSFGVSLQAPNELDDSEDVEFVNRMKARYRHRLQERWNCNARDHSYCFSDLDGAHIPLSEDAIEVWTSALCDSTATLLDPPQSITQSIISRTESDAASVMSTASSHTIQYQRAFRLGNLSLTDLRSARVRLRNSFSLSSVSSTSTSSSGAPGIGYISGKGIKWVGIQILNAFVPLEIRRRQWLIRRLVKRMHNISTKEGAKWLIKSERKITRALENLLELSSENYKSDCRTTAITQGTFMEMYITASMYELSSEAQTSLSSMVVKVFPLYLLQARTPAAARFADDLRETLLQNSELAEKELLLAEITTQLCIELACGTQSSWRRDGYETLWHLYQTSCCKRHLRSSAMRGVLMEDLAKRVFEIGEHDAFEHFSAVNFFAEFANDVPRFRHYISGSAGIPFLISSINFVEARTIDAPDAVWDLCEKLAELSAFGWCVPILFQQDICPTLVKLLSMDQHGHHMRSWVVYCIIRILRNLSVHNKDGRKAVGDAMTDNLRQMLPNIGSIVQRELGDAAVLRVKTWIGEMWPQCNVHS